MIRWAAMLPSTLLVGKDGKTAFERRRGRRCDIPTEILVEKVWYRELRTRTERKDKLETEWKEGLWLGHSRNSNEIYIGTRSVVVRAWAIRKKPDSEQWDGKLIKEMRGTPARPGPNMVGITIPISVTFDRPNEEDAEERREARAEGRPRSTYILPWMLVGYGYTDDCPGCAAKKAGLSVSKPHSATCGNRVEERIGEDPTGKETKDRADEKWKQWAARESEARFSFV